jgi:hypothetical protein
LRDVGLYLLALLQLGANPRELRLFTAYFGGLDPEHNDAYFLSLFGVKAQALAKTAKT